MTWWKEHRLCSQKTWVWCPDSTTQQVCNLRQLGVSLYSSVKRRNQTLLQSLVRMKFLAAWSESKWAQCSFTPCSLSWALGLGSSALSISCWSLLEIKLTPPPAHSQQWHSKMRPSKRSPFTSLCLSQNFSSSTAMSPFPPYVLPLYSSDKPFSDFFPFQFCSLRSPTSVIIY